MAALAEGLQLVAQLRQRRIVAGAEGGQRDLLIAGIVAGIHTVLGAQVAAAVADGAVHIARLTEAAATDAAPEQLQHHPILHDLGAGNNGIYREIRLVHVVNDALCHHSRRAVTGRDGAYRAIVVVGNIVQAGNVNAVQLCGGTEKFRLVPALAARLAVQLHQLHGDVLTLAQAYQINEIGDRLGVVHGGAAGDHQRGQAVTLGATQGDLRQIQHVKDGGKGHLIAHGKGHNIEIGDGVAGFQCEKWHVRLAHLLLHVAPRGKDTLAPHAVHLIHDAIEDPHAQIGHADLVGIRKAEGDPGVHRPLIFDHRVILAAHIAGRLLHTGQDPFQLFIHSRSPVVYQNIFLFYLFCGGLATPNCRNAMPQQSCRRQQ